MSISAFDPQAIKCFCFGEHNFDFETGVASLSYALDNQIIFSEKITFPGSPFSLSPSRQIAFNNALRILHLFAGVSYYKTAAPPKIDLNQQRITKLEAEILNSLYTDGLAEFAWNNQIDIYDRVHIESNDDSFSQKAEPADLERRSLIPVGGGKDSIVTIEMLKSMAEPMTLFSVGSPKPIRQTVSRSGLNSIMVKRILSPNLGKLNQLGALNGHVPITAVISAIASLAAVLYGYDNVIMSNERSASSGNFEWLGHQVNHQYSKGFVFESGFAKLLRSQVATDLNYFSLLRPLSEIAIAERFAKLEQYHDIFTSCNRVFVIDENKRTASWCGNCPKCRFVYLVLAPFMPSTKLTVIFNKNLLDDPAQLDGYNALVGRDADKPFECVGEIGESVMAFKLLTQQSEWQNATIVKAMAPKLDRLSQDLQTTAEHQVPQQYQEVLRETSRT